jgi:hypothetical protein
VTCPEGGGPAEGGDELASGSTSKALECSRSGVITTKPQEARRPARPAIWSLAREKPWERMTRPTKAGVSGL